MKSCLFQVRQLSKIKPLLSKGNLKTLIYALITSCLDYCNARLIGISQASTSRLQPVQNPAAQSLSGASKQEHITPILASLHWLPVQLGIHFKIILFVIKSPNGHAPFYQRELLHPCVPSHSLRSANAMQQHKVSFHSCSSKMMDYDFC